MRRIVLAIAVSLLTPYAPKADVDSGPKLVVILVVDQMRADYVDRFKTEWLGGFHRLLTDGAWFRQAAYPYLGTVTCAGHATIATGAFPRTHGIIHNGWWDRGQGRVVTCTEDAAAKNLGYGGVTGRGGDSAHQLLLPTFADELRTQRSAHVVSLSLKNRSAVMLAGRAADAVVWMSDDLDGWVTSTAFTAAPVPAVESFIEANRVDADYGKTWTRLLPDADYREPDDAVGEAPPAGWTRTLPHVLTGAAGRPDPQFRSQWQRSPYADAYIGRLAASLTQSLQLGRHQGTDVLAVAFSSPDLVGHAFGPRSQETHDMYAHLDRTIGQLLDGLDALVGRDHYLVALTSDHGVADIPEQALKIGQPAGRISSRALLDAAEQRAQATLGPGKYIAAVSGTDLYFAPGVYQKLRATSGALLYVLAGVAAHPGISRVFRAEQLADRPLTGDGELRAAALSYMKGRSGDLVIVPKPGWMMAATGTTHGSASADDQRVPILMMGPGIKPGEYSTRATPADIAPTLAALRGVTMAKAEGRLLVEAMSHAAATSRSQPH
jgi:predicted AlkP superfamily pyrophosphatase or phosphodiesterase